MTKVNKEKKESWRKELKGVGTVSIDEDRNGKIFK